MAFEFHIPAVDSSMTNHLENIAHELGLPDGSLGLLESIVHKLVLIQKTSNIELGKLHHLVFCGDHGIYSRSHQASLSTLSSTDHVNRLLNGTSPVAKICQQHNAELSVIDCGLAGDEPILQPALFRRRIAEGTRDFTTIPAMTQKECEQAVKIGSELAAMNMAEGAKVLSFGALGLGNTTSAAAMTMAILSIPPEQAVTNRNRSNPLLVRAKIEVLTQALELHRPQLTDGWSVVRFLGGFEIAAIMGAMAMTAELGGMFLVDGFACSAALLALKTRYSNIIEYAQFANQSSHSAQRIIMKHLNQRPLLSLHLGLGEGIGSLLAWPSIVSAVSWLRD